MPPLEPLHITRRVASFVAIRELDAEIELDKDAEVARAYFSIQGAVLIHGFKDVGVAYNAMTEMRQYLARVLRAADITGDADRKMFSYQDVRRLPVSADKPEILARTWTLIFHIAQTLHVSAEFPHPEDYQGPGLEGLKKNLARMREDRVLAAQSLLAHALPSPQLVRWLAENGLHLDYMPGHAYPHGADFGADDTAENPEKTAPSAEQGGANDAH